jgi:hypothetical protein
LKERKKQVRMETLADRFKKTLAIFLPSRSLPYRELEVGLYLLIFNIHTPPPCLTDLEERPKPEAEFVNV